MKLLYSTIGISTHYSHKQIPIHEKIWIANITATQTPNKIKLPFTSTSNNWQAYEQVEQQIFTFLICMDKILAISDPYTITMEKGKNIRLD